MSEKTRPSFLDFIVFFDRAISERDFTANEQHLYFTLLCINNSYRWCETFSKSDAFLMDRMKIGRKAFHAARNGLKQKGLINFTPSKKRGTCTQYQIIDNFCTYQKNTQRDIQEYIQTYTQRSGRGAANKDKREKNKDNNPPKSPQGEFAAVIENYTGDEELKKALYDYITMRKNIKKPITVRGLELALKKLDELAKSNMDKIAVLNQSVMSSWQGLFPLKEDKKNEYGGNYFLQYVAENEKPNHSELEALMHEKFDKDLVNDWSDEDYANIGW